MKLKEDFVNLDSVTAPKVDVANKARNERFTRQDVLDFVTNNPGTTEVEIYRYLYKIDDRSTKKAADCIRRAMDNKMIVRTRELKKGKSTYTYWTPDDLRKFQTFQKTNHVSNIKLKESIDTKKLKVGNIIHLTGDESMDITEGNYKIIHVEKNLDGSMNGEEVDWVKFVNQSTGEKIELDGTYLSNTGYWENAPQTVSHSFTKKVSVQESRAIIKRVLNQLKSKGLLKESPEGESNKMTTDLQNCVSQLTAMKDQIGQILITNMDSEETTILSLIDNQIDFISTTLNNLITTSTAGLVEMDNPAVNMSVDKVIEKPDVLKKLEDKKIDVNVVDDDGKSLVEGKKSLKEAPAFKNQKVIEDDTTISKFLKDRPTSEGVFKTAFGDLKFSNFANSKIKNYLANQDYAIDINSNVNFKTPLAAKTDKYVLVYVSDIDLGDILIITPLSIFNKKQIFDLIIDKCNLNEPEAFDII